MKNLRTANASGIGAVSALLFLISWTAVAEGFDVSDEQIVRLGIALEQPRPVAVMTVATGPAEIVVPPASQAIASAPMASLLSRLTVAAGDSVTAGAVIAELDSADLLEWQREFLDAHIEAELATLQLERDRALVADGIVAERRLEESRARHRVAAVRLEQSRQQLLIAGLRAAEIERLAESGILTSRLELRAPFDGIVTAVFADPGARVSALDPILRLADISAVWAEMHLSVDRAVAVTADMWMLLPLGSGDIVAPIAVIGQVIEPETQTVLIRAELENADSRLRVGQFIAAQVVADVDAGSGYSLPASALVRQGDDAYVFIRQSGTFVPVRVHPIHEDDRRILLAGGIEPGIEVATRGTSTLKSLWLASLEGGSE